MIDNEIKKAFEEHIESTKNIKYGARKMAMVDVELLKNTLNLINRKDEEIYRLKEVIIMGRFTSPIAIRAQQSLFRQNSEHINRLKSKIERLTERVHFLCGKSGALQGEIQKYKEENNKLKYQVNRLKQYDEKRDVDLHSRLTAEARAKAIKEVLDEITERLHEAEMHGNYEPSLTFEIVNDIKKKMGGGE